MVRKNVRSKLTVNTNVPRELSNLETLVNTLCELQDLIKNSPFKKMGPFGVP